MTREEWDKLWWNTYGQLQPSPSAFAKAHDFMRRTYGPRPDKPSDPLERPGVVGVAKAGLKLRKVFQMKFKFDFGVIATALGTGLSAAAAAYTAASTDSVVSASEWALVAWAFLSAVLAALTTSKDPTPPPEA